MLIPLVTLGAAAAPQQSDAEAIRKLSVLGFLLAELPREVLDRFVDSSIELGENEATVKDALLLSRTILGPFATDMMATAISWLDNGARKVVLDAASSDDNELQQVATAASELPSDRVVLRLPVDAVALAAEASSSAYVSQIQDKIKRLQDTFCGVVLQLTGAADVTTIPRIDAALKAIRAAFPEGYLFAVQWSDAPVADATTRIADLHHKGVHVAARALPVVPSGDGHAQFIDAGRAFVNCIRTDRSDKLITTVVVDEAGVALGLVYSNEESVLAAIASGRGVYYSRSRQGLWKKGESSGNVQELVQLDLDCDSDALRFMVRQTGAGFCHLNTRTCWGESGGLQHLQGMLESRLQEAPEGSYTKRLFNDPVLLRNKLVEEAQELAEAETRTHVAEEAADVMYFAMVRCVAAGATLADVEHQLNMRSLKVKRRPGNSKAYRIDAANEILNQQK